jgi:hypothetical protein
LYVAGLAQTTDQEDREKFALKLAKINTQKTDIRRNMCDDKTHSAAIGQMHGSKNARWLEVTV